MTSIFDGHEDKSPKELASELGISDLSVVDNAGKEITDVFQAQKLLKKIREESFGKDTKFPSNDINDNSLSLLNHNLWTDEFVIRHLRPGMVLNLISLNVAYKVLEVNEVGQKVIITPITQPIKLEKDFSELKELLQIYKKDIERKKNTFPSTKLDNNSLELEEDNLWTDEYTIKQLKAGMKARIVGRDPGTKKEKLMVYSIAKINHKKKIVEIGLGGGKHSMNLHEKFKRFKTFCKIYKEDLLYTST